MPAILKFRSILVAVFAGLACASCFAPFACAGDEVFRVAGRPYTAKELCGSSLTELRKQFDDEVRKVSDARIREILAQRGELQRHPELKGKLEDRAVLEDTLWKFALGHLLDYAVRHLILAHVTESIARQQGIDLEDYYDARPLRDALKRQLKFQDFLWEHKNDPSDTDDALYAEAVKNFRVNFKKEHLGFIRNDVRRRLPFMRWTDECLRRSDQIGEYGLKAMLANYLLCQACEEGIYNDRGRKFSRLKTSTFQIVEVSGYRGSKAALEEFLSKVVDKEGELSRGGISELQEWLRDYAPWASVSLSKAFGTTLFDGSWFPAVGVLYQPGPTTYRIYLLAAAPKETPEAEKAWKIFTMVSAYRLAVTDHLPKTESLVNEWKFDMEKAVSAITSPGVALLVSEVKVDKFVKQDYPGDAFKEFEDNRTRLDTYVLRAATVSVEDDAEAARALIAELKRQSQDAKTAAVRKAYEAIAEGLSKKFKQASQKNETVPQAGKTGSVSRVELVAADKSAPVEIGAEQKNLTVKDNAAVLGSWTVVGLQVNGRTLKEIEFHGLKWVFTAEKLTWSGGGADDTTFLYQLDSSTEPKHIDLTFPENKNEGPSEGIYSLDGDSLKVCIGKLARPTDMTAKAGSRRYLYTLTKEKK